MPASLRVLIMISLIQLNYKLYCFLSIPPIIHAKALYLKGFYEIHLSRHRSLISPVIPPKNVKPRIPISMGGLWERYGRDPKHLSRPERPLCKGISDDLGRDEPFFRPHPTNHVCTYRYCIIMRFKARFFLFAQGRDFTGSKP